jgi:phosphoribosylformimino-5-aminoimidazole carboxamide ribotide isomerase
MNLDRVGSGEGPDTGLIDEIRRAAPNRQIIAAGGVRDGQDLERLAASGVTAVLVATALHDGRIDTRSLSALSYL